MINDMIDSLIARRIGTLIASWPVWLRRGGDADTRLEAHFAISMVCGADRPAHMDRRCRPGRLYDVRPRRTAMLSMLVNGDGRVATRGTVDAGGLKPAFFSSNISDNDGVVGLQMTFADGSVETLRSNEPPPKDGGDRIPVYGSQPA